MKDFLRVPIKDDYQIVGIKVGLCLGIVVPILDLTGFGSFYSKWKTTAQSETWAQKAIGLKAHHGPVINS